MRVLSKIKQYKKMNLHISAGVRVLMTVVVSIVSIYLSNPWALALMFAVSAVYLFLEVKLSLIIKVYIALAVFAGIAALSILGLYSIMPAMASKGRGVNITAPFERMGIMANMVLAMAMNTSLSGLIKTFSSAYIPGFIKLPLIVMVRFIPTFFNDIQQLREAIRIRFRGRSGLGFWFRHPALWSRIFFMPLIIRLIRSGDELAVASELKGLSPKTKFGNTGFVLKSTDPAALFFLVAFSIASIVLQQVLNYA